MNSPRPKFEICAQIRGGQHYLTDETVGFVWLHPSLQHHLWPLKPHWPPVFPSSKASVIFPCATQSRRGLVTPATFGKKGVISKPQGRRNNWPGCGEHLQHSRGWRTPLVRHLTMLSERWQSSHRIPEKSPFSDLYPKFSLLPSLHLSSSILQGCRQLKVPFVRRGLKCRNKCSSPRHWGTGLCSPIHRGYASCCCRHTILIFFPLIFGFISLSHVSPGSR